MKSTELPSMEEMLSDLGEVKGLDFFWQSIAMVMDVEPRVLTPAETEIVERMCREDNHSGK